MVTLTADELRARASRIRLVITDSDGTLTDSGVYYSAQGEEMMRFSRRDGMGIELLARAGIPTAILTRESSEITRARAKKLKLEHVFLGVRDKLAFLTEIETTLGVSRADIAYIGDDVNDLGAIVAIASTGGLAGAPADATPPVRAVVHKLTDAHGGFGAFRQFTDWILELRSGGAQ